MVVSLNSRLESNKSEDRAGEVRASPMLSGSCSTAQEAGSYLRLIESCITQLKAQGPSRTCNERKEEGSCSTAQDRA